MGGGRAEGWSAIGDGGQSQISLLAGADGTHLRIFESSQLDGVYGGELLYILLRIYFMHTSLYLLVLHL